MNDTATMTIRQTAEGSHARGNGTIGGNRGRVVQLRQEMDRTSTPTANRKTIWGRHHPRRGHEEFLSGRHARRRHLRGACGLHLADRAIDFLNAR